MAQKSGVIFEHGDEVRRFLRGRNRIVEAWLNQNWGRLDVGMTGPVTRETVSKVLGGRPVLEPTVKALHVLRDEIRADPWAWCKPPERVEDAEGIRDYAEYAWWYDLLKPSVSFSRFERMTAQPLPPDEREYLNERLSEWSSRLRAACVQYMADHALVRALRADDDPEYQRWTLEDSGWRLGAGGQRHRVGNPGLHGRSPEEIGQAYGLSRATMPLPLIEEARLAYERPEAAPVHDHISEPIEPWMGLEFEGVEREDWEDHRRSEYSPTLRLGPGILLKVEHRVVYYWDGSRYQVEDVEKFARIKEGLRGEWRVPTGKERDLLLTGVDRKHETVDELLARRDQWVADEWAEKQSVWSGAGMSANFAKRDFPDGVPESEAARLFDLILGHLRANQDAIDEQREVAHRRSIVMRDWRRRA